MKTSILFAILSATFAALATITAKSALKNIDSFVLTVLRSLVISGILVIALLFIKHSGFNDLTAFTPKEWGLILITSLFGALSWLFYFKALKLTNNTTLIYAIDKGSVIIVAMLAALLFKESLSIKTIAGILFILAGLVFIG